MTQTFLRASFVVLGFIAVVGNVACGMSDSEFRRKMDQGVADRRAIADAYVAMVDAEIENRKAAEDTSREPTVASEPTISREDRKETASILSLASAQEIKKGDTTPALDWAWVDVKNSSSIRSGNGSFEYGDSCGIGSGGTVTVVGIEENRLLAKYSINGTSYGTSCPTGILFFTTKEEFSEMKAAYRRILEAEQAKKDSAMKESDIKKGDTATVPGHAWVDVKNLGSVRSGNSSFEYGHSCSIKRGGTVTVAGIDGDRLLVRYSVDGTQYGAPCPTGILFFTTKEKFSKMTMEYHKIITAEEAEQSLVKRLSNQK